MSEYVATFLLERDGEDVRRYSLARSEDRSDIEALVVDAIAYARRPTTSLDARIEHDLRVLFSARRRLVASCLSALRQELRTNGVLDDPRAVRISTEGAPHIVSVLDHEGTEHHTSMLGAPSPRVQELIEVIARNGDDSNEQTFSLPT